MEVRSSRQRPYLVHYTVLPLALLGCVKSVGLHPGIHMLGGCLLLFIVTPRQSCPVAAPVYGAQT